MIIGFIGYFPTKISNLTDHHNFFSFFSLLNADQRLALINTWCHLVFRF